MPLSILSSVNRAAVARVVYRASSGGGGGDGIYSYTQTNGNVYTDSGYTVISYTNTAGGSLNITGLSGSVTVYYLAVGGGGGGGSNMGGGGGGGAVTYGSFNLSTTINISITVGVKGNATTALTNMVGNPGGSSIISGSGITTITAGGGGGGGTYGLPITNITSTYGGSGGGAGYNGTGATVPSPAPANYYYNKGGNGANVLTQGGGGGAASAGTNGGSSNGGVGGNGIVYSSLIGYNVAINNILATLPGTNGTTSTPGSNMYLSTGGAGDGNLTGPSNGAGGKGGSFGNNPATFATPATVYGSGGGGSGQASSMPGDAGGAGYQGVVLLAFKTNSRLLVPTDVSSGSLQLWLDANDPNGTGVQPSNGATLSTVVDKSGLSNNATPRLSGGTTATTITWNTNSFNTSYPSLVFDTTKYLSGSVSITGAQMTAFYVYYMNSSTTNTFQRIMGCSNGSGGFDAGSSSYFSIYLPGSSTNANIQFYRKTSSVNTIGLVFSTPYIMEAWIDGTKQYLTYDGSSNNFNTTTPAGNMAISYYAVGADPLTTDQTNTSMLSGNIAEVVMYNTSLSNTDRAKIEGYLAWKWGLQARLPTVHPYKNAAPTIDTTQYSFTINSINWRSTTIQPSTTGNLITGNGTVYGTATTNSTTYDIYAFGNTNVQGSSANNYTINYTSTAPTYIYALAVGGGGGGGNYVGSGGGAGGVVMMPIYIPAATNQTITVSVGAGGNATIMNASVVTTQASNGVSSTITFSDNTVSPNSITALYGNFGATAKLGNSTSVAPSYAACGAGGASSAGASAYNNGGSWAVDTPAGVGTGVYPCNNSYYNFGNNGARAVAGVQGGGGGAGGNIYASSVSANSGVPGIQCVLPGIKDFSSNIYPTKFGNFYWGGGGGSPGGIGGTGGAGGIGGGGGGYFTSSPAGTGGIYNSIASTSNGSPGAPCTGGGGGATYASKPGAGGNGGSGIVILAIPRTQQSSFLLQNYNFASPSLSTNTNSTQGVTIPNWTTSGTAYYVINSAGSIWSTSTDASYACPYVQFFYTNSTSAVTLSQTVTLAAQQYTMTFCAAVNSNYTSGQFTVSVGGTTVYTSSLNYQKVAWNVYSFNFTPATAGSNVIQFSFSCSVGITQILIF